MLSITPAESIKGREISQSLTLARQLFLSTNPLGRLGSSVPPTPTRSKLVISSSSNSGSVYLAQTDAIVAELLDRLEDQLKKGKRAGLSQKLEAQVVVIKAVKEVIPTTQKIIVTRKKCNDKVAQFRNRQKVQVYIMNNSGQAKDKDTSLLVSSQQGIDNYLLKHLKGKKFLY